MFYGNEYQELGYSSLLFAQQQRPLLNLLNQYYNIPTDKMQLSKNQQWKPVCSLSL